MQRHLRYGGMVLGLCGGFQMLGQAIHDPQGLEGPPGSTPGLGWLDFSTTLAPEKQLRNTQGRLADDDIPVHGYEIHHGISSGSALAKPLLHLQHGPDGAISADGRIMGCYLHGLFDSKPACDALLRHAGLTTPDSPDYRQLCEVGIDCLADAVAAHLDQTALLRLLGLSGKIER